jgi:hypothetical protein
MRSLLFLLSVLLTACASTTLRVPTESPRGTDRGDAAAGDGAPTPNASAEDSPARSEASGPAEVSVLDPAQQQELEAVIRRRLEGNLDVDFSELRIVLLGSMMTDRGPIAAFRVEADGTDGPDGAEQLLLVVTQPFESDVLINTVDLGLTTMVPGAEDIVRLESFEGLRVDHGMIRADVAVTTSSVEMDTCADCRGRRSWPTLRQRSAVLCVPDDEMGSLGCALVPMALDVVAAGVEIDSEGREHPMNEEDPAPFQLSLEIIEGGSIRLTLSAGTLPSDQAELVGEHELVDFIEGNVFGLDEHF